jgi:serine kinase
MPFDDSNIRKLIKDQIERRIHFSNRKLITNECKELILHLLEPEIKYRGTISNIYQSNWMRNIIRPIISSTSIN